MTRIRWYLGRSWTVLDPVLTGSAAVLALAAALHWGVTLPAGAALAEARSAADQARADAAQAQRTANPREREQAALAQTQARFPQAGNKEVGNAVIRLQALAIKEGLVLERGSYQLSPDPAGALERYSISLPVKGSYPALRAMIRQAGRDLPNVVLDSVEMRRGAKNEPVVDAQLEFSGYFRTGP